MKPWLISALNAVLSGAFATIGSFAAHVTFKQGAMIVGIAAVGSFAKWYAQHPIPGGQPQ